MYSSPEEYIEAVHQLNITFPVRGDFDFMPYSPGPQVGERTGLYTSRPLLKGKIREAASTLRDFEFLFTIARQLYPSEGVDWTSMYDIVDQLRKVSWQKVTWE
jgi:hypothetical protein